MNLSKFRIKSALACLAILAGTVIPASSTFAQSIGIPANAVIGGNDTDGTVLYVCSGIYNNQVYGGKRRSDGNSCDMSYGGSEVFSSSSNYVVLTNPLNVNIRGQRTVLYWEPSSNLKPIPGDAVPTGFENGYSLYSCRGTYNGGTGIGKIIGGNCNFGYGGLEIIVNSYDVLATYQV
ncbi:MAG: DM9 repeat-containing protein [Nostoc sp.]